MNTLNVEYCLDKYSEFLYNADIMKKLQSTSLLTYPFLSTPSKHTNAGYLSKLYSKPRSLDIMRSFTQIRLRNKYVNSFRLYGATFTFRNLDICCKCDLVECESLEHIIFRCPHYEEMRFRYFPQNVDVNGTNWYEILDTESPSMISRFIAMIGEMLKNHAI